MFGNNSHGCQLIQPKSLLQQVALVVQRVHKVLKVAERQLHTHGYIVQLVLTEAIVGILVRDSRYFGNEALWLSPLAHASSVLRAPHVGVSFLILPGLITYLPCNSQIMNIS